MQNERLKNLEFYKGFTIGVDHITLYNLTININEVVKFESATVKNGVTIYKIAREFFTLKAVLDLKREEKELQVTLDFNPNHVLYGNNFGNSRSEELKEALEKIVKYLKNVGITLNYEKARIGNVEINRNLDLDFNEYFEVFFICVSGNKKAKIITGCNFHKKYSDMLEHQTIYCNTQKYTGKIYNKTLEQSEKRGNEVPKGTTRIEWYFKRGYFKEVLERKGYTNSFKEILENFGIIEIIFNEYSLEKFINTGIKNISDKIKPNLWTGYRNFKRTVELQKKTKRKISRGVFNFLDEEYWIFDYNFLIEILKIETKNNFSREKARIEKDFLIHNNLTKFNKFSDTLRPNP